MDRGDLNSLVEGEREMNFSDTDDSEEEGKEDGGIRRGDPNKFDSLCDGVLGMLSIIHASMQEMLDLKDELMKHRLPPNVLTKISLSTSRLYRGIGDMHMPVNELIRMVRIYSTPWEEKSAALKKLHEDYDAKKSQLNIAIKRLQLVDAQSRRMNREKRLMNWEKLFCRVTTAKGHGRRWKFLIDSFKKKAKDGIPALQQYLDAIDQDSDSEGEESPAPVYPDTQIMTLEPSDDEISESDEESGSDFNTNEADTCSNLMKETDSAPEQDTYIRPPMKDTEIMTGELDYDRYLYVRVYKPVGLQHTGIKCNFKCGKESYKTNILDPPVSQTADKEQSVKAPAPPSVEKPLRGPGMRRLGKEPEKSALESKQMTESKKDIERYDECLFSMPEGPKPGIWYPSKKQFSLPEHLRVSVHHGSREDIIAMATIDMDDLISLDLPTVVLPLADDVADIIQSEDLLQHEEGDELNTLSGRSDESDCPTLVSKFNLPKQYWKVNPYKFPLYPIDSVNGSHSPCGQLPLVFFWAKKIKPTKFHKTTDSETLHDIVLDLTGIDLDLVTKEDLHPVTRERAISAMSIKEEEKPEMVLRSDYNRLLTYHQDEKNLLQEQYESRLNDLAEHLQQLQEEMEQRQTQQQQTQTSRAPSRSPTRTDPRSPTRPSIQRIDEVPKTRKQVSAKSFSHWGEHLPKDFFERLRWFEEASLRHKQEVADQVNRETSEQYEKKLAGEFKLGAQTDEDATYNAMNDVSLPALFMPSKGRDLTIYNPRASKYFHATGSAGIRLTQPPSMVQLPPLPRNKVNIVNLFDVSQNFRPGGNDWLIERYMLQQQLQEQRKQQRLLEQEQAQTPQAQTENVEMYNREETYTPYSPNTQQILSQYQMEKAVTD